MIDAGVDLLDDLDESAALIAALDAVVTPMVSTLDLAGALAHGPPTFAFVPTARGDRMLGTHRPEHAGPAHIPWFGAPVANPEVDGSNAVRIFSQDPPYSGDWAAVFKELGAALDKELFGRDDTT